MATDITKLDSAGSVNDHFLVVRKERKRTRRGSFYGDIVLGNKSGVIPAKIWDLAEEVYNSFDKGSVVKITGSVESYNNKPQIVIRNIELVDEADIDSSEFMPVTDADVGELQNRLRDIINSFKNEDLKRLLTKVLLEEAEDAFSKAPASKGFHHAYLGGLLEHTIAVAALCDGIARLYPDKVNRDLLVAGALVHDIGKISEFSYTNIIDYSTEGRLIGHHVLGYELLKKAAEELGVSDEALLQLGHLILSHHGSYENQSPRKPKTIEALLLHLCDDTDAKIHAFEKIGKSADEGADWSQYNRILDRFVYLKRLD